MAHWLNDLTETSRQAVYAQMRAEGATMDRYYSSPSMGGRGIAIGAQGFDDVMQAEVRRDFLAALRNGATPEEAAEIAKTAAHAYVTRHNAQRPKDANWQRSVEAFDWIANGRVRPMREASGVALEALAAE